MGVGIRLWMLLYVFTEFTDNLLTEDEMTKKLPAKLLKHKDWLSRQMTVQNRNDRIRKIIGGLFINHKESQCIPLIML